MIKICRRKIIVKKWQWYFSCSLFLRRRNNFDWLQNDLFHLCFLDSSISVMITLIHEFSHICHLYSISFMHFLERIFKHFENLFFVQEARFVRVVFGKNIFDYLVDFLFCKTHILVNNGKKKLYFTYELNLINTGNHLENFLKLHISQYHQNE